MLVMVVKAKQAFCLDNRKRSSALNVKDLLC